MITFILLPLSKEQYPLSELHPEPRCVSSESLKKWDAWLTYSWESTKRDAKKAFALNKGRPEPIAVIHINRGVDIYLCQNGKPTATISRGRDGVRATGSIEDWLSATRRKKAADPLKALADADDLDEGAVAFFAAIGIQLCTWTASGLPEGGFGHMAGFPFGWNKSSWTQRFVMGVGGRGPASYWGIWDRLTPKNPIHRFPASVGQKAVKEQLARIRRRARS